MSLRETLGAAVRWPINKARWVLGGLLSLLAAVVRWPIDQTRGFLENVRDLFQEGSIWTLLPPSVESTVKWILRQLKHSLGFGTPGEQITASIALAVTALISSVFTLGTTLVFAVAFAFTFLVGVLRLWPFVERVWPLPEGTP